MHIIIFPFGEIRIIGEKSVDEADEARIAEGGPLSFDLVHVV